MNFIRLISRIIGMLLMAITWIGAIAIGFFVLFESFDIVSYVLGDVAAFLSLIIAPVMLAIAPWYLVLQYGDWNLLLLTYGTIPVFWIMFGISSMFMMFGESDSED